MLCVHVSISYMKPHHVVQLIMFVFQLVIFIFILTLVFISSFIWGSLIYDFYLCVCIYIYMSLFVCIFYSVAGHHGRTVWLNGPPCINIFEIKKINVPWTVKDRTRGPALRSGFANGHRVALVGHRARKSVPDSAGEWPTFLPPPLESCSGTVNGDGSNCSHHKVCDKIIHSQTSTVHPL